MLLAQKPQSINFRHRRQPASLSAFAVVPHPTNTPGLFAIAKPIRQPSRPHPRSQSPRCSPRGRPHRSQHQTQLSPSFALASQPLSEANVVMDVKEEVHSTTLASPLPKKSGSHPSEHARPMSHPHQAPGTIPLASDAQATTTSRSPRARRSRHKSTPAATIPLNPAVPPDLTSQRPITPERSTSAKNHESKVLPRTPDPRIASPTKQQPLSPSNPIPIPERGRGQSLFGKTEMSRSEPGKARLSIQTLSPVQPPRGTRKRRKNKVKRTQDGATLPLADWDFPVKDSDDDGEAEEDELTTPIRQHSVNQRAWFTDGPKTAPLEPSRQQFPFFTFPLRVSSPSIKTSAVQPVGLPVLAPAAPITPPKHSRPDHRRAPSQPASLNRGAFVDGVFHFSEDEGDRSAGAADIQKKMAVLFGKKLEPDEAGIPSVPPLFSNFTPSPKRRVIRERDR